MKDETHFSNVKINYVRKMMKIVLIILIISGDISSYKHRHGRHLILSFPALDISMRAWLFWKQRKRRWKINKVGRNKNSYYENKTKV